MGAFKLGKMTFGSLFKQPETVKYPFEKKPQPEGLKGHIAINAEDCILCGMCERSCTTNCITVDKAEHYWEIQRYQCVQCGYCVTVCPKKCLFMHPDYAPAATEQKPDRFDVPVQPKGNAAAKVKPAEDKPKPAPAKAEASAAQPAVAAHDEQLEALISLMEPEKAEKVKAALA